jgi:hypothetical protein
MTVLLVPILQATHCVLLSTWPKIAQRVLTGCLADSPASDSTPVKASENGIKLVVSGNFAAFIRFQLTMLGL